MHRFHRKPRLVGSNPQQRCSRPAGTAAILFPSLKSRLAYPNQNCEFRLGKTRPLTNRAYSRGPRRESARRLALPS